MKLLLLGCTTLLLFTLPALAENVTVTPAEDEHAVLQNPDMGWVLYENYPVDPAPGGSSTLITLPDEPFDGVAEVAIMFSWYDVEKREGHYDFADVDRAYDYWTKRGKRIQLRMSTETLLWWDNASPPRGKGPPDYVVERLGDERKQRREDGGLPPYVVVDARDPFYLERLSKFLSAVADHFDEKRPVTLIDLRGFGVWGEWHSGFRYASVDDRRAALTGVIDCYAKAFPENWVSLSYSYDPGGPKELYAGPIDRYDEAFTTTYKDYLRFSAFDHALTKPNVTFRRDGCGGAVHSNEHKLCEEAFATLARGPFMSEFMDGYAASKRGNKGWIEWKVQDALSLHPNYINLLGYQGGDALNFLRERRDLIEHGLRTMGYRFVPTKLTFPPQVKANETFDITSEWVNRAVGPAMRPYRLRLLIVNGSGEVVASVDTDAIDTDKWVKGRSYSTRSSVEFGDVVPGKYQLCLAMIDPTTGKTIALPLKHGRGDASYPIGPVSVAP